MEPMNQGDVVAHTARHPWTREGLWCPLVQKQGCFYSDDLNLTQPIKTFLATSKCAVQCHRVHSHCRVTVTTVISRTFSPCQMDTLAR